MSRRGFTLIELMMVVIVVGILASMALPQYTKTKERTYWREAQDILGAIYAGEQTYFTGNNSYYAPGTWSTIFMDNPNGATPVTLSVPSAAATTFTASAARGDGRCMTVNETRTWNVLPLPAGCTSTWTMP